MGLPHEKVSSQPAGMRTSPCLIGRFVVEHEPGGDGGGAELYITVTAGKSENYHSHGLWNGVDSETYRKIGSILNGCYAFSYAMPSVSKRNGGSTVRTSAWSS